MDIESNEIEDQGINPEEIVEIPEAESPLDDLKDVDFFALPYNERVELKAKIKEQLPDRAKEAMDSGWTPKEMFRGKYKDGTDKPWDDYDAFMDRIENEAPVRNERMKKTSQERDGYKRELDAVQKQLKDFLEFNREKAARDLENEGQAVEDTIQTAKEDYDWDKFEKANAKKNSIEQERLKMKQFEQPPIPPVEPEAPQADPDATEWAKHNQWIVRDERLLKLAQIKDQELEILHPDLSKMDRYNLVSEKLAEQYPDRNPVPRKTYQATRNNNNAFGSQPKAKTFSDLPQVEQAQAMELIEQGIWKDKKDFLKTYNWS